MSKVKNLYIVASSDNLHQVVESSEDRVLVILFYSKRITDCQRARSIVEKLALDHTHTIFCITDMEKFEGESRFVTNVTHMPRFDCYYKGAMICSQNIVLEHEIKAMVENCERYILTMGRNPGAMTMMQNTMGIPGQGMGNISNMNTMNNISDPQRLLNHLQMTNPMMYAQLYQNPVMLQQYIMQQLQLQQSQQSQYHSQQTQYHPQQLQQSQQMLQNSYIPQVQMSNPTLNPTLSVPGQSPAVTNTTVPLSSVPSQTQSTFPSINHSDVSNINSVSADVNKNTPLSMEQLQQTFKIFQAMQKMGFLPIPETNSINTTNTSNTFNTSNTSNEKSKSDPKSTSLPNSSLPEGTFSLPDGSQLVPLGDGRYGLIKKN